MSGRAPTSLQLITPGTGGVFDYAAKLADALQAPAVEFAPTTDTSGWSGDMLLLHYSNYGYQKRGVPAWLPEQMRSLRKRFRVLGVVFHELYAFGPPWRSAFWLSVAQQRIARDTLRQADFWYTNREVAARWLLDASSSRPIPHRMLPVFSNVGEPPSIAMPRERVIAVFGGSSSRARTYAWKGGEIYEFARRHGLRIHDIGPPLSDSALTRRMLHEGVVVHGMLAEERVSEALLKACFGVVEYGPSETSKSGIFAAYAAHGVCPILLWRNYETHDGLLAGVNYAAGFGALDALRSDDLSAHATQIGRAARHWYEPHCVDAHVDALKTMSTEARP